MATLHNYKNIDRFNYECQIQICKNDLQKIPINLHIPTQILILSYPACATSLSSDATCLLLLLRSRSCVVSHSAPALYGAPNNVTLFK